MRTQRALRAPSAAVLAVISLLALVGCGSAKAKSQSSPSAPVSSSRASASSTPVAAPSDSSTSAGPSPKQVRAHVTAAITALATGPPRRKVSVAALNTVTGASYSMGAASGIWTASVYKLLILETLLLRRQQEGTTLSQGEVDTATRMIENSDNASGYDMFLDIGGTTGLSNGARALGLSHTVPGRSDPTFTTTSAKDCLTLLKDLVTNGPLHKGSRSFVLNLMRDVEADQRWGVGAVADRGTHFANKNGWLGVPNTNGPGEDDNGRWVANSVGVVTVGGQQVLMAVLTEHNPDFATGVDLVRAIAKQAVKVVASPAPTRRPKR
jgi:hypothetical protein